MLCHEPLALVVYASAIFASMPSKEPAYLLRLGKLRAKLKKEAAAKNKGVGPKWSLHAYIIHLIETHPERK